MGNCKSSSSEFPYHGNNDESDQSKKNKSQKLRVTNKSELGGSTSFMRNPGLKLKGQRKDRTGDNDYPGSASRLIKVMSYNVWNHEKVELIKRMEAIGQLIQKHSPDIIFFQEVTPNIYQIFHRSKWWRLYKCSVSPEKATTRRYFCMLLSKLPVKKFSNKNFKNSDTGKEICLAELDDRSSNNLIVATSHLETRTPPEMSNRKRIVQAKEAISHLNNFPNVVFGGDMNWDDNTDGRFPLHGGWIDAWTELKPAENGWTFDTKENKSLRGYRLHQKRSDRFVCKLRDFEIIDIEIIGMEAIPGLSYYHENNLNPVYPSDHFGLLLIISTV